MNYPGFAFRALRDDGISSAALLKGTGLTEALLVDPSHRSDFGQLRRFYLNIIAASGDPHIGVRLAGRFRASQAGLPFLTAMHAASFAEAIQMLGRFLRLTFPALALEGPTVPVGGTGSEVSVSIRPTWPLGDIAYFATSGALVVCDGIFRALLQAAKVTQRAELVVAKPEGWEQVAAEIPFPVRFEAERNALFFPASLLDMPLPTHDPINLQQLLGVCERLVRQARIGSAAGQVLRHLEESGAFAASIGQVAAALGLSERGLRRQLARSSTSYRRLVQEARYSKAQALLADPTISIATIAFDLGFDTPSNFTRSFKQWSGVTPSAFRSGSRPIGQTGQN